jgi:hypothetical protein
LGEWDSSPANPNQGQIGSAAAFFHNFMGQSLHRAIDFRRRHQLVFFNDVHWANILA